MISLLLWLEHRVKHWHILKKNTSEKKNSWIGHHKSKFLFSGNSINVLGLHDDDNSPCYVKHHSPHATSRSRMVNGMNFTTSPPSTSRCHWRHLRPSVRSSLHRYYAWQFLLQAFSYFLKALRGSFKLNPVYSRMDTVFSTVVCLSPEWHTVPKCFTPGFQLKSKHLEGNCHHIPTKPPKVLAKSVCCVPVHIPLTSRAAGGPVRHQCDDIK